MFAERLFDFAVFHHPSYSATSSQTAKEQLLRQDSIDPLDIQNTVDEQGAQTVVASGGSEQTI